MQPRATMIRLLRGPTPLLLAVIGVVLVAIVSARGRSAVQGGPGLVPGLVSPLDEEPAPVNEEEFDLPEPLETFATLGLATLLVVLVALLLLGLAVILAAVRLPRLRRGRQLGSFSRADEPDDAEVAASEPGNWMRRAVGSALDELRQRAGGEPGDAVVAAWLVLERAAAEAGSARRAYQTPTEFTTAVLAEHQVNAEALRQLRALYQRARFGVRGSVTEADVAAAEEALAELVGQLARSST